MSDVGEVRYKAVVDNSDVDSQINKTEKSLSGIEAPLQKTTSKFGTLQKVGVSALKGIGTAFIGLVSAAGAGVAAVAKMGIEYNSQMQQYQTAFSTMLGDAEKAQQLTDTLRDMAASTPLAMTDLADASQILLAFGSSAEQLPDQLKRLGDVAQGDAQALGTMATAFGRIQSNGYASLEEINMMIDQGFNPLQIIAEQTGESMGELRDRVSAGEVSFEELSNALVIATSEGGQFFNAMENQSKTFNGQVSTLKDNLSMLAGTITEDLFAGLAENTLPQINAWVDELMRAYEESGVEGAAEASGGIIAALVTNIANGTPSFIDTAVTVVDSFLQGISENSPALADGALSIVGSLVNGIITLTPSLGSAALSLISALLVSLDENSGQMLESGYMLLQQLVMGIVSGLPNLIESASQLYLAFTEFIFEHFPDIMEMGVNLLLSLVSGIISSLPELIDSVTQLINTFLQQMTSHLPEIIQKGFELVGKLISGILSNLPALISAAFQLIDGIKDAFTSIDWIQVGKDVINGIINGLSSLAGSLWNAARSLANDAMEAIRGAFDSHSPSKKAEKLAKTVPQGVVKAFDEDTTVDEASIRLGKRALDGLTADVNYNIPDVSKYTRALASDFSGTYRASTAITVPLYLDGREVARATAWWTGEQLSWEEM